jgi:hypothetical protein
VRVVRIPCEGQLNLAAQIKGREYEDGPGFLDFLNPDETGESTLALSLKCVPAGQLEHHTVTLNLERRGRVRHVVDLDFDVTFANPLCGPDFSNECPEAAPPPGYDPTPKPCTFEIDGRSFQHIDGPASDKNGEFFVDMSASGDVEESYLTLHEGDTGPLDMDTLARVEVPCGQSITVPFEMVVIERDGFVNDRGSLSAKIGLTCPPEQPDTQLLNFTTDVFGRNGKGAYRHRVGATVAVTPANSSYCVVPPLPALKYPCEFGFLLTTLAHTDSPSLDKNGQFAFDVTLNGTTTEITTIPVSVRRGETGTINDNIGKVVVPCGTTREVALNAAAAEIDGAFLGIDNADEIGAFTDTITLKCPPDFDVVSRTYSVDFKNSKGKVKHEADVTIEQSLVNWSLACECVSEEHPSCDQEIVFRSFHHDSSSIGDDPGDFDFTFWLNGQRGWWLPEETLSNLHKGDTAMVDELLQDSAGANLLGTWYQKFVRVPQGQSFPVAIQVDGQEYDVFGNDEGTAHSGLILTCDKPQQELTIPMQFTGKNKVKHTGTVTLQVRPH